MIKKIHWLMLLVVLAPAWSDAGADEPTYRNYAERQTGGFRVEIATDKYLYEPGDLLRARYLFETTGDSLIVFSFSSAPYADIGLFDGNADSLLEYSSRA